MPKKHEKSFFERLSTLGGAPLPEDGKLCAIDDADACAPCASDMRGLVPCLREGQADV